MVVSTSHGTDLSYCLCFIWRAGVGVNRQPRDSAAIRIRRRRPEPARLGKLLAGSDGVLAGPKRFHHSSRMLGRGGAVAAPDFRRPAAFEFVFSLCALSFALLRRSGVYGLSVGPASARIWLPCDSSEHSDEAGHMAAALVAVPANVSFGRGQATERRPHLG